VSTEDLDFSDVKKKKKSSKKKATFDLEAFEKELNESNAKEGEEDVGDDGEQLQEVDEADLGDDPFARGEEVTPGPDAGNEPWLTSNRDYTYPEVHDKYLHSC
jgi:translation initiation factor 2 subunit 2